MNVAPAVRAVRTAAIEQLISAVPSVGGRVYTQPVPTKLPDGGPVPFPYLVIGGYSERYSGHYGHGGSENGFDIRGVVQLVSGDAPLLALWEEVYQALQGVTLEVEGHSAMTVDLTYFRDYAEPSDHTVRHFVARASVLTAVTS